MNVARGTSGMETHAKVDARMEGTREGCGTSGRRWRGREDVPERIRCVRMQAGTLRCLGHHASKRSRWTPKHEPQPPRASLPDPIDRRSTKDPVRVPRTPHTIRSHASTTTRRAVATVIPPRRLPSHTHVFARSAYPLQSPSNDMCRCVTQTRFASSSNLREVRGSIPRDSTPRLGSHRMRLRGRSSNGRALA